jgi:hypothetical protein
VSNKSEVYCSKICKTPPQLQSPLQVSGENFPNCGINSNPSPLVLANTYLLVIQLSQWGIIDLRRIFGHLHIGTDTAPHYDSANFDTKGDPMNKFSKLAASALIAVSSFSPALIAPVMIGGLAATVAIAADVTTSDQVQSVLKRKTKSARSSNAGRSSTRANKARSNRASNAGRNASRSARAQTRAPVQTAQAAPTNTPVYQAPAPAYQAPVYQAPAPQAPALPTPTPAVAPTPAPAPYVAPPVNAAVTTAPATTAATTTAAVSTAGGFGLAGIAGVLGVAGLVAAIASSNDDGKSS